MPEFNDLRLIVPHITLYIYLVNAMSKSIVL